MVVNRVEKVKILSENEVAELIQDRLVVEIEWIVGKQSGKIDNEPVVVKRSRRESKPSQRLLELKKYLIRERLETRVPDAFVVMVR